MVRDSTSSYKIDNVIVIKNSLNPKGHQNPISGSKVTAILLKRWLLPIGGASLGRVCACSLRSRLVSLYVCLLPFWSCRGWAGLFVSVFVGLFDCYCFVGLIDCFCFVCLFACSALFVGSADWLIILRSFGQSATLTVALKQREAVFTTDIQQYLHIIYTVFTQYLQLNIRAGWFWIVGFKWL